MKKSLPTIISIFVLVIIFIFAKSFMITSIDVQFMKKPMATNELEVVKASQIKLSSNIFTLNEKEISKHITSFFIDNNVEVVDIERVFPNKVVIHVKERYSAILIKLQDKSDYILTDVDFQMKKLAKEADININNYIFIKGIQITNTLNLSELVTIRHIIKGFLSMGMTEESVSIFIQTVEANADDFTLITNHNTRLVIQKTWAVEEINQATAQFYADFLTTL